MGEQRRSLEAYAQLFHTLICLKYSLCFLGQKTSYQLYTASLRPKRQFRHWCCITHSSTRTHKAAHTFTRSPIVEPHCYNPPISCNILLSCGARSIRSFYRFALKFTCHLDTDVCRGVRGTLNFILLICIPR